MNIFKISKVAEAVISDLAGYPVRVESDTMGLSMEPRDESGNQDPDCEGAGVAAAVARFFRQSEINV